MKLLLTSNGLQGKIKDIVPSLLTKNPADCSVAFITTAAYGEEGDPETWLDKYRQQLRDVGITNIENVDLRNVAGEKLENLLATKDIVYVNGGNTFFLLYYVRQSGFEGVLRKFLDNGKLYIGVSAGSIICCPTIDVAGLYLSEESPADTNNVGLTDLTGLNFVSFIISPHYEESQREIVNTFAKQATQQVVALNDMQAVLVQDNTTEVIGDGEEVRFNAGV